MANFKILVADDSKIIRLKLGKMIEDLGYTVVAQAENGMEAVGLYDKFKPDLVTMDVTMPQMDGIEATRIIVEKYPDAVILMLTSHAQEKIVTDAIEAGAKGFVVKPVSIEKLKESINNIMR